LCFCMGTASNHDPCIYAYTSHVAGTTGPPHITTHNPVSASEHYPLTGKVDK
jgi:hypothetical protein